MPEPFRIVVSLIVATFFSQSVVAQTPFLSLPFNDPTVIMTHGPLYADDLTPHASFFPGALPFDFDSTSNPTFDVFAAAGGYAIQSCQNQTIPNADGTMLTSAEIGQKLANNEDINDLCEGYGRMVIIAHNDIGPTGARFFTLYAHLEDVSEEIQYNQSRSIDFENWTPVSRGQEIGVAGETGKMGCAPGNSCVHLHFEVFLPNSPSGGYSSDVSGFDPYGVSAPNGEKLERSAYSSNNLPLGCGASPLWLECPPTYVPPPPPSVERCTLGTPLSTVSVTNFSLVTTFDGTGFDASRTADGAWTRFGGIDYVYYAGVPFANTQDLGLATSSDSGASWSKATSTPLISRPTAPAWARQRIVPYKVLHENGEFRLWFSGNNTNLFSDAANIHGFGYASSADGLSWTVTPSPIRSESGPDQGARLLEVVKQGTRYRAYYLDLDPTLPPVTYVADSADGITFVGPDQRVAFGDNYQLLTATAKPGDDCSYGIWRNRTDNSLVATTSINSVDFEIVSSVTLPTNITPNDIRIEGNDIILYASRFDGNVNWNFGNISLVTGRARAFVN